jgi:hypothetical protein
MEPNGQRPLVGSVKAQKTVIANVAHIYELRSGVRLNAMQRSKSSKNSKTAACSLATTNWRFRNMSSIPCGRSARFSIRN